MFHGRRLGVGLSLIISSFSGSGPSEGALEVPKAPARVPKGFQWGWPALEILIQSV